MLFTSKEFFSRLESEGGRIFLCRYSYLDRYRQAPKYGQRWFRWSSNFNGFLRFLYWFICPWFFGGIELSWSM